MGAAFSKQRSSSSSSHGSHGLVVTPSNLPTSPVDKPKGGQQQVYTGTGIAVVNRGSMGFPGSGGSNGGDAGHGNAMARRRSVVGQGVVRDKYADARKHLEWIDLDELIERLLEAGTLTRKLNRTFCLKKHETTALCLAVTEILMAQPPLLELATPLKIVGDIHGQYQDLLRIFEMCGYPPTSNYLFLGDYVDRGKQSLETICLLFCFKIKYPENFFILRGNHECANINRVYGFYDECKRRVTIKAWKGFTDVFNCLPIVAIVDGKIFCVHGGLSPTLETMDQVRQMARPVDIPESGFLNDLLWSDPSPDTIDWEENERGVSFVFGPDVVDAFLHRHDLDLVARGHMVVEDGYEFFHERSLVTIFSAPAYCGEFNNLGAVMSVNENLLCSFQLVKPMTEFNSSTAIVAAVPTVKTARLVPPGQTILRPPAIFPIFGINDAIPANSFLPSSSLNPTSSSPSNSQQAPDQQYMLQQQQQQQQQQQLAQMQMQQQMQMQNAYKSVPLPATIEAEEADGSKISLP